MNARQMIAKLDSYGGIIPFNSEELDVTLRALRLLAAAEANDGTTAEVLPSFIAIHLCSDYTRGKCGDPAYDDCCCQKLVRGYEQINNERNGLAARVGELERDAERYRCVRDMEHGDLDAINDASCSPGEFDAAIDAARGTK